MAERYYRRDVIRAAEQVRQALGAKEVHIRWGSNSYARPTVATFLYGPAFDSLSPDQARLVADEAHVSLGIGYRACHAALISMKRALIIRDEINRAEPVVA